MLLITVWIMILGTNVKMTITTGDSLSESKNISILLISEEDVQVVPLISSNIAIQNIDKSEFQFADIVKSRGEIKLKDDARQEPPLPVVRLVATERMILPVMKGVIKENQKLKDNEAGGDEQENGVPKKKEAEVGVEAIAPKVEDKIEEIVMSENRNSKILQKTDNLIISDAIKKEESELVAEAGDALAAEAEHDKKHEELKKTLEQHKIEQRQMLQEQKEIINTLKQQKRELEREKNIVKSRGEIKLKDDARQEPPLPVVRLVATERMILPVMKGVIKENQKLKDNEAGGDEQENGVPKKKEAEVGVEAIAPKVEDKIEEIVMSENRNSKILQKTDNLIISDAIKKEESELVAEAGDALAAEAEHDKKHEELKKTLEQHKIEQRQMLQEQKEIINTLKQQKRELEREKKEKVASEKAVERVNHDTLAAELAEHDKKHEELKKTLEQHKIEQRQMLQEQKEIINALKQQKQQFGKK